MPIDLELVNDPALIQVLMSYTYIIHYVLLTISSMSHIQGFDVLTKPR